MYGYACITLNRKDLVVWHTVQQNNVKMFNKWDTVIRDDIYSIVSWRWLMSSVFTVDTSVEPVCWRNAVVEGYIWSIPYGSLNYCFLTQGTTVCSHVTAVSQWRALTVRTPAQVCSLNVGTVLHWRDPVLLVSWEWTPFGISLNVQRGNTANCGVLKKWKSIIICLFRLIYSVLHEAHTSISRLNIAACC